MKTTFLIHQAKKQSAVSHIDTIFPLTRPRHWRVALIWITALTWAWFVTYPSNLAFFSENTVRDLAVLFTAILLVSFQASWFVLSFRYRENTRVSFDLAKYLFVAKWKLDSYSLIHSETMREVLVRAGLPKDSFSDFFKELKGKESVEMGDIDHDQKIDLSIYLGWLFDTNRFFAEALSVHGITRNKLTHTAYWVEKMNNDKANVHGYLSIENLYLTKSLGVEWTKSTQIIAKQCGSALDETSLFAESSAYWRMYRKDINSIESVLLKENRTHALIVAGSVVEGAKIVSSLAHAIQKGEIHPSLEYKRLVLVDDNSFWEGDGNKEKVKEKFKALLKCAWHSGAILVIDDFDKMINKLYEIDHSLLDDFEKFLSSIRFHVLAIVSEDGYHQTIIPHQNILKMFSVIRPVNMGKKEVLNILTEKIREIEEERGVLFTLDALEEIIERTQACGPSKSIQEASAESLDKIAKGIELKKISGIIGKEQVDLILNSC